MRKVVLSACVAGILALMTIVGTVRATSPPPPPPPGGGTAPVPPVPLPCPPTGCPTATATATAVPTATPTNTAVPLFIHVSLAHGTVSVGHAQKITATSLPAAKLRFTVAFPNHTKKTHSATANGSGRATWSFKQPPGKTSGSNHTAKVTVKATGPSGGSATASKKYRIK